MYIYLYSLSIPNKEQLNVDDVLPANYSSYNLCILEHLVVEVENRWIKVRWKIMKND